MHALAPLPLPFVVLVPVAGNNSGWQNRPRPKPQPRQPDRAPRWNPDLDRRTLRKEVADVLHRNKATRDDTLHRAVREMFDTL
jgi:hypothetical protein